MVFIKYWAFNVDNLLKTLGKKMETWLYIIDSLFVPVFFLQNTSFVSLSADFVFVFLSSMLIYVENTIRLLKNCVDICG